MIKEIKVGGVKHSITLADDMVGRGLKKDENGTVYIKVPGTEPKDYELISGIVVESEGGLCLKRSAVAFGLAGTGLEVEGGWLRVSTGLLSDPYFMQGLAYNLSGSGLVAENGKLSVYGSGGVDANTLCGTGLDVLNGKLYLNPRIAGSGLVYDINTPVLDVNINRNSGLAYEYSSGSSTIGVNIVRRYSGLRLFFNEYGELDVTQD